MLIGCTIRSVDNNETFLSRFILNLSRCYTQNDIVTLAITALKCLIYSYRYITFKRTIQSFTFDNSSTQEITKRKFSGVDTYSAS